MKNNIEVLQTLYMKALTVNTETTPSEALNAILIDNFRSHGSVSTKDKDDFIRMLNMFWKIIPDLKWEPQEILTEGEKYVVRSRTTGTPNSNFLGIEANGTKSFDIMTIDIHKIQNGKIIEIYHCEDWETAVRQIRC